MIRSVGLIFRVRALLAPELVLAVAARARWLPPPSLRRKLLRLAQAWISVPSTVKCSLDSSRLTSGRASSPRGSAARPCREQPSRFLLNGRIPDRVVDSRARRTSGTAGRNPAAPSAYVRAHRIVRDCSSSAAQSRSGTQCPPGRRASKALRSPTTIAASADDDDDHASPRRRWSGCVRDSRST